MSQADRGRADGHSLERFQIVIAPVKAHLFRRAGVPQRSQARFAAAQLPLQCLYVLAGNTRACRGFPVYFDREFKRLASLQLRVFDAGDCEQGFLDAGFRVLPQFAWSPVAVQAVTEEASQVRQFLRHRALNHRP